MIIKDVKAVSKPAEVAEEKPAENNGEEIPLAETEA